MLKLILLVVPLGLDTFAVSTAIGLGGLRQNQRLRLSLLLASFETMMPLVGLVIGHGLGHTIGAAADYLAIATLVVLGIWMLKEPEETEQKHVQQLASRHGLALIGLGLSISIDELVMGFTIGLLHLSIWLAITLIGAQAFLLAQVGMRLGARVRITTQEWAERLAAIALLALGALLLAEKLAN
jgi:putative Mn2+ efflux pump MntP